MLETSEHQPKLNTLLTKTLTESDYRASLHNSVCRHDKQDFNLILSMLTKDVTEFDQFHLDKDPELQVNQDLYDRFHIRKQAVKGLPNPEFSQQLNELVNQRSWETVKLQLQLELEPLVFNNSTFDQQLVDNLDINTRARLEKQLTNIAQNDNPLSENSDTNKLKEIKLHQWFDTINQARAIETAA